MKTIEVFEVFAESEKLIDGSFLLMTRKNGNSFIVDENGNVNILHTRLHFTDLNVWRLVELRKVL